MPKRSYDQYCGLARALELVGQRWTLLIIRDLSLGPQRYGDLAARLDGIASGLLAERLRQLEELGLAQRGLLPPPANVAVYELTDEGQALATAIMPLALWGTRHLGPSREGRTFHADWVLFGFRAAADASKSVGVIEMYELHVEDEVVTVVVDDGTVEVVRGPAPVRPALTVHIDPETLIALGSGDLAPHDAIANGRATVAGDDDALGRAIEIFGASATPAAATSG